MAETKTRLDQMNPLANQALASGKEEIAKLRDHESGLKNNLITTQGEIERLEKLAMATAHVVAATTNSTVEEVLKKFGIQITIPRLLLHEGEIIRLKDK